MHSRAGAGIHARRLVGSTVSYGEQNVEMKKKCEILWYGLTIIGPLEMGISLRI